MSVAVRASSARRAASIVLARFSTAAFGADPRWGKLLHLLGKFGGRTWARTKDPLIKSQLLYQLSYASTLPCRRALQPRADSAAERLL